MIDSTRRKVAAALVFAPGLVYAQRQADKYPSRSIRFVVPFPPGGTNDIVARVVAERLSHALGQAVIIENRGGAGGMIGTKYAASASPDGHTLLLGNAGALAAGLGFFSKTPYEVLKDFIPISLLGDITIVLVATRSLPVKTTMELVALAKAQPGTLNAALPGTNSIQQLLTGLFKRRAEIDFVEIPYSGGGPAMIELLAGRNQFSFVNLPTVHKYIQAGQLKPLAVAGAKRSELLPDVPTLQEAGFPGLTATAWNALLAPAGTPREIISQLNRAITEIMSAPETRQLMSQQGMNALSSTPQETYAFLQDESVKWLKVIRDMGLQPDKA